MTYVLATNDDELIRRDGCNMRVSKSRYESVGRPLWRHGSPGAQIEVKKKGTVGDFELGRVAASGVGDNAHAACRTEMSRLRLDQSDKGSWPTHRE